MNKITHKEYLRAKEIIRKYEENNVYRVAVISLNRDDFRLWKLKKNYKVDGLESPSKFKSDGCVFHCISKVCDLCSITFDSVVETEHAKENKEYEQIMVVIRPTIISGISTNSHN